MWAIGNIVEQCILLPVNAFAWAFFAYIVTRDRMWGAIFGLCRANAASSASPPKVQVTIRRLGAVGGLFAIVLHIDPLGFHGIHPAQVRPLCGNMISAMAYHSVFDVILATISALRKILNLPPPTVASRAVTGMAWTVYLVGISTAIVGFDDGLYFISTAVWLFWLGIVGFAFGCLWLYSYRKLLSAVRQFQYKGPAVHPGPLSPPPVARMLSFSAASRGRQQQQQKQQSVEEKMKGFLIFTGIALPLLALTTAFQFFDGYTEYFEKRGDTRIFDPDPSVYSPMGNLLLFCQTLAILVALRYTYSQRTRPLTDAAAKGAGNTVGRSRTGAAWTEQKSPVNPALRHAFASSSRGRGGGEEGIRKEERSQVALQSIATAPREARAAAMTLEEVSRSEGGAQ